MALSKYGLEAKAYADNYAQWQNEGGEKAYNDALNFKSLQDNSFNVRNFLGGGNAAQFGQSLIDGTVGVIGNLADFAGNPGNIGTDLNNYVMAQESAMGEAPKADFSWDYIANGGLARGMGNLAGSIVGLGAPVGLAALTAPLAGIGTGAAAVGGAIVGGGLEAMAEGGGKLREALENGASLDDAQGKAREVAAKNAALLIPGNLVGLGLLKKAGTGMRNAFRGVDDVAASTEGRFANVNKWLDENLSKGQKTALEFGKGAGLMGGEALNESMQEAIQQGIQDSVEPDKNWGILPQNWNPEQQDAFKETIGPMILMGGVGGAGRVGARKLGDMLGAGNAAENTEMPNFNNNLFGAGTASYTTQGSDIDAQVEALKPGWSAVIPQVFGVLENRFGITGAQISSGCRTS